MQKCDEPWLITTAKSIILILTMVSHGQRSPSDLQFKSSTDLMTHWLKVNPQMTRLVGKRWKIRSGEIIMQQKGRRAVAAQMILYTEGLMTAVSHAAAPSAAPPVHCRFSCALQVLLRVAGDQVGGRLAPGAVSHAPASLRLAPLSVTSKGLKYAWKYRNRYTYQ